MTQTLTELAISQLQHPILFKNRWTMVPVPLHVSRLKWRGFNQAELLANGLALAWAFDLNTHLLIRKKATEPQMKLSGIKRKHNLQGAFEVVKTPLPSWILLVDDVATTCSTLNECAVALKKAGAKEVWGLTLSQKIPLLQ